MVDVFPYFANLVLGQILDAGVGVDTRICESLVGRSTAYSEDLGNPDLNSLLACQLHSDHTSHHYPTTLSLPTILVAFKD